MKTLREYGRYWKHNVKVSAQRNGQGLSASLFNRIVRNKIKCYPDQIHVGHISTSRSYVGHSRRTIFPK